MEGKAGGEAGEMGQRGQVPRSGTRLPWEIALKREDQGAFFHDPKKLRASNSCLSLEESLNMPSVNWHLIPLSDNSPSKPL